MAEYTPKSILNRYFVMAWFVAFLLQASQNLFSNTISVYVVSLGYSNTQAGLQAVGYGILAIIARFIGSYLCDFRSRRICMAAGCAVYVVASAMFGLPGFAALIPILFLRSFHGLGYSLGTTGYFSAVVDVTPKNKVSVGLGLNLTAQGLAQLVGGVLAVALVIGGNYRPLFFTSSALAVLGVVFASTCNYESKYNLQHRSTEGKKIVLSDFIETKVFRAAILVLVYYLGVALIMSFTVAAAKARGIENGALFYTTAAVGMILGNIFVVRIAEKIGRIRTMIPLCFIAACCPLCVAFHKSIALLFVGGFLYGLTLSATPVIQSSAVEDLPFERRGAGTATLYIAMDLTLGLGPLIWGIIIDATGYKTTYIISAIIFAATTLLLPYTLKKRRAD